VQVRKLRSCNCFFQMSLFSDERYPIRYLCILFCFSFYFFGTLCAACFSTPTMCWNVALLGSHHYKRNLPFSTFSALSVFVYYFRLFSRKLVALTPLPMSHSVNHFTHLVSHNFYAHAHNRECQHPAYY
jgi:hypothetical protein